MRRLLAIDVGNSKTRMGLFENGLLQSAQSLPTPPNTTQDAFIHSFQELFQESLTNLPIFGASVVSKVTQALQGKVTWINHQSPLDFSICRTDPATLGADIIAGSQAAVKLYATPVIVIDAGTATTVTYINQNKAFLGGAICPGLGITAQALFEKTSALKPVALQTPTSALANTTETAIQAGLMFGHADMMSALVGRIKKEENLTEVFVLCTGGAIWALQPILPPEYIFDPELVLKGIALIAANHYAHEPAEYGTEALPKP